MAAQRHIKELPAKLRLFLPFFVIKSLFGIRFCEIEKEFCEIEKEFLRIEKDFALSPPAMRVVRRAFEEGENRPCRLGRNSHSPWDTDSQRLGI